MHAKSVNVYYISYFKNAFYIFFNQHFKKNAKKSSATVVTWQLRSGSTLKFSIICSLLSVCIDIVMLRHRIVSILCRCAVNKLHTPNRLSRLWNCVRFNVVFRNRKSFLCSLAHAFSNAGCQRYPVGYIKLNSRRDRRVVKLGGESRRISDPAPLIWDPLQGLL